MDNGLVHAAAELGARVHDGRLTDPLRLKRCVRCGKRGLFVLGPEVRRLYGLLYRCRFCGRFYKKPIRFLTSRDLRD